MRRRPPARGRAGTSRGWLAVVLVVAPLAASAALWPAPAAAQPEPGAAPTPGPETMAIEALQCWRRIGRHAVHVGERFDMLLTCAAVDTATARVVPDLGWLEPETLGVSPFEVLGGERYDDVVRGPRRFFQYRYALRIIGEDYFGLDVELPPLELRYRIERSLDGRTATEGRELSYILPPESIRVLSLVPATAADIRELPGETFGDVEARLFRANLTGIAAAAILVAAGGVLLLGALRARREWRGAAAGRDDRAPAWRIARTVLGELQAVRDGASAAGWTGDLVARGLSALRVTAALAVGRPVAQSAVGARGGADDDPAVDPAGRLAVRRTLFGREHVGVSSALTARDLERALPRVEAVSPAGAAGAVAADTADAVAADSGAASAAGRAADTIAAAAGRAADPADRVASLRAGLAAFGAARYGAAAEDAAEARDEALTAGLEAGLAVARSLQVELFEPIRRAMRLYRRGQAWAANQWRP